MSETHGIMHASAQEPAGLVQDVQRDGIRGWIIPIADADRKVTLRLNGRIVSSASAMVPAEHGPTGALAFFFNISDLWKYVSSDDVLAVYGPREPLAMAAGASIIAFGTARHPSNKLLSLLGDGHVFNKKGKLQLSKLLNKRWQNDVFALFRAVRASVDELCGANLYPCYGTLLGAIREGDFIGHDDDFDTAYISRSSDVAEVRAELLELAHALIVQGYRVTPGLTCLKVAHQKMPAASIDVFHSFFDPDGRYKIPFGIAGVEPYRREDLVTWTTATIGTEAIEVPADPDKLLSWLYGPHWRTPDPNFNWERERKIKVAAAYPSSDERAAIHWDNHFAHSDPIPANTLQTIAVRALAPGMAVLDLGCGSGSDCLFYASSPARPHVFGADRSVQAIQVASRRAAEPALQQHKSVFVAADLAQPSAVGGLIQRARATDAGTGAILLHIRQLLDSMPHQGGKAVIAAILDHARAGDIVAIEEREFGAGLSDRMLEKSFRWRVDFAGLRQALLERAREIVDDSAGHEDGSGLAAFHRLIVRL